MGLTTTAVPLVPSTIEFWTKIGALGAVLTATFALFAVLGAAFQLFQTHRAALQTRAHEYLRRYDEQGRQPCVERAHRVVGDTISNSSEGYLLLRRDLWKQMSFRERLDVYVALNYWEEMGGMYNRKLVHRKIIDDYFGAAALSLWQRSQWLVLQMRSEDTHGQIYNEWEKMCQEIQKNLNKPRWRLWLHL